MIDSRRRCQAAIPSSPVRRKQLPRTAAYWTGASMLFALYRTIIAERWALVGVVGAATCTLRQSYLQVTVPGNLMVVKGSFTVKFNAPNSDSFDSIFALTVRRSIASRRAVSS